MVKSICGCEDGREHAERTGDESDICGTHT